MYTLTTHVIDYKPLIPCKCTMYSGNCTMYNVHTLRLHITQ